LSRIENALQDPNDKTLHELLEELNLPVGIFFSPYLEHYPTGIFAVRDEIVDLLDSDEPSHWQQAEDLMHGLVKRGNFETAINRQFILRCKAQLNELRELNPEDTVAFVNEGLALTYEKFEEENFDGKVLLIFEEVNLLYILAQAYHRMNDISKAITLLRHVQEGIVLSPEDAREKEKKSAFVMLTLSHYLIKDKNYSEALEICLLGNSEASTKRNRGRYSPDFMYNIAVCYHNLGDSSECKSLLQMSYFGYVLLRKVKKAKQVRKNAKRYFNIEFDTYGVEDLVFEKFDTTIGHGDSVICKDVGSMLAGFRSEKSVKTKEIYEGICSQSNYNKMENGEIRVNVFYLEAFLQRLGRDIDKYIRDFPSIEDFNNKQLRDEVNILVIDGHYEVAIPLLEKLATKKRFKEKKGVCAQFIKMTRATIFGGQNGFEHPDYLEMLKDAMLATRPKFEKEEEEESLDKCRLSYYEVMIANQMAMHYCNAGNASRGLKLFERLRDSMNRYYVDEREKVRMYPTIFYNYSKHLGRAGRRIEALEIIKEGEEMELRHKRLTLLPAFALNRAYNLQMLGKVEESVPIWVMAYHGSRLFNYANDTEIIAEHIQKHFDIKLD